MRVVFCDDEAIIRKLIELSLKGTAYEFRLAAGGNEVLGERDPVRLLGLQ